MDYSGSSTPDVTYTYDALGNRLSMADGMGTTSYVYDALNRPTSVTFPGSRTVSYEYDNAGNRSRIVYPDSKDVDYTFDAAGRLSTVTDWLSNVTEYTYNNAGMLTLTELPNGVTAEYGYDNADRLTSVVNEKDTTTLSSFTYTLDAVGNRTAMADLAGTNSYTYDALYRLTDVTYSDTTTEEFGYDAVGNRTSTAVLSYTYDDADQMLTAGATSYDYDGNGNQVERGSDTFSYDHEGPPDQLYRRQRYEHQRLRRRWPAPERHFWQHDQLRLGRRFSAAGDRSGRDKQLRLRARPDLGDRRLRQPDLLLVRRAGLDHQPDRWQRDADRVLRLQGLRRDLELDRELYQLLPVHRRAK